MRRQRALLLLALALAAVLAWLVAPGVYRRDGVLPRAAAPEKVERAAAPEFERAAQSAGERGSASAESERAVAAAGPAARAPDTDALGVELLVLEKGTSRPLPGAELAWWPRPEDDLEDSRFGQWLSEGELEERIAPDSRSFTADGEGRARVPSSEHGAWVVARAGELWGYASVDRWPVPPVRVELVHDYSLRARVVDTLGRPVAGARVALRSVWEEWHEDRILARSTEPDGIAELRHVGHLSDTEADGSTRFVVALAAVVEPAVEHSVSLEKPPAEPIELVLEATGACEVRLVDLGGRPLTGSFDVRLRALAPDEDAAECVRSQDYDYRGEMLGRVEGGVALFEQVELGRQLLASASPVGSNVVHRAHGAGPATAGERATITLRVGERAALVRGRLVDEHGAALADTKLRARAERRDDQESMQDVWRLRSDSAGRFEVALSPYLGEGEPLELVLSTYGRDGEELCSARGALPGKLSIGVHELGDLTLRPSPLLAAGSVVDSAGAPVVGAWVTAAVPSSYDEDTLEIWWDQLWQNRARSDAAGRFTIRSERKCEQVKLSAEREDLKGEAQVVPAGSVDLVLTLGATGTLAGSVLLDASVSPRAIALQLELVEPPPDEDDDWERWATHTLDENGSFQVRGLRPGFYDVRVIDTSNWEALHSVARVRVESGATTRDPRLDPLDLRAALRAIVLSVHDEDDLPIEQGMAFFWPAGTRALDGGQSVAFQRGKAVLLTQGGAVDVQVCAPGFVAAELPALAHSQNVVLRRGPTLRFVLTSGLRVPSPPVTLQLQVEPLDHGAHYVSMFSEPSEFGERGEARVSASFTGRASISLKLTRNDAEHGWSMIEFDDGTPREVVISERLSEQTVEVHFDPEALAAAVERLLEDD